MVASPTPEIALSVQSMGAMAPQQIAALAQQQQLQNLTQQLQSQLSLQNMNLSFFNQVICDSGHFMLSVMLQSHAWQYCPAVLVQPFSVPVCHAQHTCRYSRAAADCVCGHRPCGAWPASPVGTCRARAAARICRAAA